jgi:hypothetical protein
MTPLGRWPQLDMELSCDGFGCSFDLIQLRFVIQIEQPVDLWSMNVGEEPRRAWRQSRVRRKLVTAIAIATSVSAMSQRTSA